MPPAAHSSLSLFEELEYKLPATHERLQLIKRLIDQKMEDSEQEHSGEYAQLLMQVEESTLFYLYTALTQDAIRVFYPALKQDPQQVLDFCLSNKSALKRLNPFLLLEVYQHYFEIQLANQIHPLSVLPFLLHYLNEPYPFTALLLWLLKKEVKPSLLIKSHVLHCFIEYHYWQLDNEKNEVKKTIALLTHSKNEPGVSTLLRLAQQTMIAKNSDEKSQHNYSTVSLTGEQNQENLEYCPVKLTLQPLTLNSAKAIESLYQCFDSLFLQTLLTEAQDEPVKRLAYDFFNQEEVLKDIPPLILHSAKYSEQTKIIHLNTLSALLSEDTCNQLLKKNATVILLAPYKHSLLEHISKETLCELLALIETTETSQYEQISQMLVLFTLLNLREEFDKRALFEILFHRFFDKVDYLIHDEPLLLKLRDFEVDEPLFWAKKNAIDEEYQQMLRTCTQSVISIESYFFMITYWEKYGKQLSFLNHFGFPIATPGDKYCLQVDLIQTGFQQQGPLFDLKANVEVMTGHYPEAFCRMEKETTLARLFLVLKDAALQKTVLENLFHPNLTAEEAQTLFRELAKAIISIQNYLLLKPLMRFLGNNNKEICFEFIREWLFYSLQQGRLSPELFFELADTPLFFIIYGKLGVYTQLKKALFSCVLNTIDEEQFEAISQFRGLSSHFSVFPKLTHAKVIALVTELTVFIALTVTNPFTEENYHQLLARWMKHCKQIALLEQLTQLHLSPLSKESLDLEILWCLKQKDEHFDLDAANAIVNNAILETQLPCPLQDYLHDKSLHTLTPLDIVSLDLLKIESLLKSPLIRARFIRFLSHFDALYLFLQKSDPYLSSYILHHLNPMLGKALCPSQDDLKAITHLSKKNAELVLEVLAGSLIPLLVNNKNLFPLFPFKQTLFQAIKPHLANQVTQGEDLNALIEFFLPDVPPDALIDALKPSRKSLPFAKPESFFSLSAKLKLKSKATDFILQATAQWIRDKADLGKGCIEWRLLQQLFFHAAPETLTYFVDALKDIIEHTLKTFYSDVFIFAKCPINQLLPILSKLDFPWSNEQWKTYFLSEKFKGIRPEQLEAGRAIWATLVHDMVFLKQFIPLLTVECLPMIMGAIRLDFWNAHSKEFIALLCEHLDEPLLVKVLIQEWKGLNGQDLLNIMNAFSINPLSHAFFQEEKVRINQVLIKERIIYDALYETARLTEVIPPDFLKEFMAESGSANKHYLLALYFKSLLNTLHSANYKGLDKENQEALLILQCKLNASSELFFDPQTQQYNSLYLQIGIRAIEDARCTLYNSMDQSWLNGITLAMHTTRSLFVSQVTASKMKQDHGFFKPKHLEHISNALEKLNYFLEEIPELLKQEEHHALSIP
ncbi:MAG: hypothetical protein WC785_06745 [Tatlockia sp.]|jgi:hypothetical protein